MKVFEYMTTDTTDMLTVLNLLGKEGWELCHADDLVMLDEKGKPSYPHKFSKRIWLKREK